MKSTRTTRNTVSENNCNSLFNSPIPHEKKFLRRPSHDCIIGYYSGLDMFQVHYKTTKSTNDSEYCPGDLCYPLFLLSPTWKTFWNTIFIIYNNEFQTPFPRKIRILITWVFAWLLKFMNPETNFVTRFLSYNVSQCLSYFLFYFTLTPARKFWILRETKILNFKQKLKRTKIWKEIQNWKWKQRKQTKKFKH